MKKLSAISLVLAIALLMQLVLPVFATEPDATEPTPPETLPSAIGATAPQAEFGTATVLSGCRTMNAQVPLGGSDRKVETAVSAFVAPCQPLLMRSAKAASRHFLLISSAGKISGYTIGYRFLSQSMR